MTVWVVQDEWPLADYSYSAPVLAVYSTEEQARTWIAARNWRVVRVDYPAKTIDYTKGTGAYTSMPGVVLTSRNREAFTEWIVTCEHGRHKFTTDYGSEAQVHAFIADGGYYSVEAFELDADPLPREVNE